jgi:hypothetical protein
MHAIEQIGAFAGLGAFFGLAVLAFLYFAQARHVRDLEEKATYVPEELDLPAAAAPAPAAVPATGDDDEEAEGDAEPAAPPPPRNEAEAARQVQIARAKAERRKRFEQRRGSPAAAPRERASSGEGRSRPEPRAMIVIGLGIAVLAVGLVFAAGRILGGNDSGSSTGGSAASAGQSSGPPPQVAVLNGTPVPGLAAKVAQEVRSAHFNPKPVSNTDTPFTVTEVMFDAAADKGAQTDSQSVASALKITKIEPMDNDVKRSAGGAGVAVVVGEDRAGT